MFYSDGDIRPSHNNRDTVNQGVHVDVAGEWGAVLSGQCACLQATLEPSPPGKNGRGEESRVKAANTLAKMIGPVPT